MSQYKNEDNLSIALKFIVERFGKEALLDSHKVEAVLIDLIPKNKREIAWTVDSINIGIVKILLSKNADNSSTRAQLLDEAKECFENQMVSEIRRDYMIESLSYALGWNSTIVESLDEYQRKRRPKKKPVIKKEDTPKKVETKKDEPKKVDVKKSEPKKVEPKKVEPEKVEPEKVVKKPEPKQNPNPKKKQPQPYNTNKKKKGKILPLIAVIIVLLIGRGIVSKIINREEENSSYQYDTSYDSTEVSNSSNSDYSSSEEKIVKDNMHNFYTNYRNSVYYGDIGYVDDYILYDSEFYNNTKNNIKNWYSKGVDSKVIAYTQRKLEKQNGVYIFGADVEYEVYNTKGHYYMKEYMDYLLTDKDGSWKIYKITNWEQIEKTEWDDR